MRGLAHSPPLSHPHPRPPGLPVAFDTYHSHIPLLHLPPRPAGLPVVLDTFDASINIGDKVLLAYNGANMGVLTVESKYTPDKPLECVKCYGVGTIEHPGVRMVAMERGPTYLGGSVAGVDVPVRDFPCMTPQVRPSPPLHGALGAACPHLPPPPCPPLH